MGIRDRPIPAYFWYAKPTAALTSRDRLSICVLAMFAHKSDRELRPDPKMGVSRRAECCSARAQMRGPGITPVSIACLNEKTGPPISRTGVKPRSRVRPASAVEAANMNPGSPDVRTFRGTAANNLCQCGSIMPGMRTRFPQSRTKASGGGGLFSRTCPGEKRPSREPLRTYAKPVGGQGRSNRRC
jgi:hypothetical protein